MIDLYKIDAEGVHYPSREAIQDRIAASIAMDLDGKLRASLIAMGWTPPGNDLIGRVMTCVTDSAAQVDRARPVDERASGAASIAWSSPGEAWWQSYMETLELQLDDTINKD